MQSKIQKLICAGHGAIPTKAPYKELVRKGDRDNSFSSIHVEGNL